MTMPWDRPVAPPPRQPLSLIDALTAREEISWARDTSLSFDADVAAAVDEAAGRFDRFGPWVAEHYPATAADGGRIESELTQVAESVTYISQLFERDLPGELWIKRDDTLPISGSVKARGGIHEVFRLAEERDRGGAPDVEIVVASTGNLGLAIGTVGPQLGFRTEVHMSVDAKQWKKDMLRDGGATVVEHPGLFTETVAAARASAAENQRAFFIDDENSLGLFAGYAVAGRRLKDQFDARGKHFTASAPLHVYLPCGVGGAAGGIAFGLKQAFGEAVSCHVVEPVDSPCMLLGLATGKGAAARCADYGLSGRTVADGLAVQSPSPLVVEHASQLFDALHTVNDITLLAGVNWLERTAGMVVEPSATAGLTIPWRLPDVSEESTHLVWLTGGSLLPDQDRERLRGQAATAALQWRSTH